MAKNLKRVYQFNGIRLDDIPGKTPEEVKKAYADLYPQLVSATVKGPVNSDTEEVYTFEPRVGSKG